MPKNTYEACTFQTIGNCGKLQNLHPESDLALALGLPGALGRELLELDRDVRTRVAAGTLDEGAIGLVSRLTGDVAVLAHAQTELEDVRRRRVDLVKRASAAKRETIDAHMYEALSAIA